MLSFFVKYIFPNNKAISISKLCQFQLISIIFKNLFLYRSSNKDSYILLQLLFFQILTFTIYRGTQSVPSILIILKYNLRRWRNTSAILKRRQQIALLRSIEYVNYVLKDKIVIKYMNRPSRFQSLTLIEYLR